MDDILEIAGKQFHSRLLMGSGKFRTADEMRDAYAAANGEIVTVAIRRLDLDGCHSEEAERGSGARRVTQSECELDRG